MKGKVIILAAILVVLTAGTYRHTGNDADCKSNNVAATGYNPLCGSWYRIYPGNNYQEGFTLNPENTASSINMSTLLYKKWKIKGDKLVLTSVSLGNHSASVSDEEYTIISYNRKKLSLQINGNQYIYKKSKKIVDNGPTGISSLSTAFEYFPAGVADATNISGLKHPVDFESNKESQQFRTIIAEKYKTSKCDFAGYYTVITWGCGSNCIDGVIIDTRDGKIYDLPSKKGYSDIGSQADYKQSSILLLTLVISTTIPVIEEKDYWLWNEDGKEFIRYKSDSE